MSTLIFFFINVIYIFINAINILFFPNIFILKILFYAYK